MLTTLRIKNYALLRDIAVDFTPGLNILTGETGAGKSIIVGALNIAVGERGYVENIRTGEEKATVEAVFDMKNNPRLKSAVNKSLEEAGIDGSGDELVIKREINRASKGRIFINNSPAALNFLEKLGKYLVDIHGQHDHQSLLNSAIHINLLDAYAGAGKAGAEIAVLYGRLSEIDSEIRKLFALEAEKNERLDTINYRINEIEQAGLKDDDEFGKLMREREMMVHTEAVKDSVNNIITSLSPSSLELEGSGALDLLERAKKSMEEVAKIDKKTVDELMPAMNDAVLKAAEVKEFFISYKDRIEFDKGRLQETEDRIEMMENMMRKYKKKDIKEIREYYKELKNEKKAVESNEEVIKEKEEKKAKIQKELSLKCAGLSGVRISKGRDLGAKIEQELKGLGISKAVFEISVKQDPAEEGALFAEIDGKKFKVTPSGIDGVEFMISLNPGEDLKPLVKVASGGEISRIMLAIKNILSDADMIPVLVFDEIDTGISGKIAQDVGGKLYEISRKKQLICITHLPQIAGFSDTHYSVGKQVKDNKTETSIKRLNAKEKVEEVAKLLSGEKVTETSIKAAEELISAVKVKK
jgi:DNA repair protein RecN (Recombination protein N)